MKRILAQVAVLTAFVILLPCPGSAASEKQGIDAFKQATELRTKARSKQDREKALEKYQEALEIFRAVKSEKGQANTWNAIGLIYVSRSQYRQALECYDKALDLHKKLGNATGQATTLANMGYVYRNLGEFQKALEHQDKALALHRTNSNRRGEGWALAALGYTYRGMGQYPKALECYTKALAISRQMKNIPDEGNAAFSIGWVYSLMGEYPKALESFQIALEIHKKTGNVQGEGNAISGIGEVYRHLGQYGKALEHMEKALEIQAKIGNEREEAIALNNMALIHRARGQYHKALETYEKALEIAGKIGEMKGQATTLGNVGSIYLALGQYQKALEHGNKALEIQKRIGDSQGQAWSWSGMGRIYHAWGQRQKALENYEKACEITRKIGDQQGEADNYSNIGRVCFGFAKYDDALKNYQSAREIKSRIGTPTLDVDALIAWTYMEKGELGRASEVLKETKSRWWALGKLHLLNSAYDKAKTNYEKLLASAEKSGSVENLFTAYTGLGKAYEGLEDYKTAEDYYEKGMKLTEEMRSSLLPAERKDFFEVKVQGFDRSDPAKGVTRVRMKLNQAAGSIDSSEATRARAFSDSIAMRSSAGYSGIPIQVLQEEDALVSKVAALKKDLSKTEKDKFPAKHANLFTQVQEAESNLNVFVEMLWDKHTQYASVKYPRPITLKESSLKREECVIIFDVSEEGVGIKRIANKDIAQTGYIKWNSTELESDVRTFREPFENPDNPKLKFNVDLGKTLYKKLLMSVLAEVPEGTPLIIVPDGILAVLPFESLVVSGKPTWKQDGRMPYPEGLTYLGAVYPISYYGSITSLTLVRTLGSKDKKGAKTLVVADPVFGPNDSRLKSSARMQEQQALAGLPARLMSIKDQTGLSFERLPRTSELGESLKKLSPDKTDVYTGVQAKKAILFDKPLTDYNSIVLATHGYFGNDIPGIREPVIVMCLVDQSRDQEGFLTQSEVMGMKLNADVVALTACQTGLGSNLSGEGVMSMGKAFQFAGAKSVLMSLWSVAEKASVLLTEKFFAHLKEGKNKLEALQSAREDVRKEGYTHPFYWASFILVGEVN
jgi:tetratricopeptide (TPR) repeat protein